MRNHSLESDGVKIINTDQKKVGRVNLPTRQSKVEYFAIIKESEGIAPKVYLSKGHTDDTSKPDFYVYKFKASSTESAKSQSVKEARRRYLRYHQLHPNTSNIPIYVESSIS